MTYRGKVKNGVVVLDEAPKLAEGTIVNVEVEAAKDEPRIGSPAALLEYFKTSSGWDGPPGELERLLAEVQQMREDDLRY